MSVQSDPRDVEALATLVANPQGPGWPGEVFQRVAVRAAHRILDSAWFADRIAQAEARGRGEDA